MTDKFLVVPDPTRKGWWRIERETDELRFPLWARFRSQRKAEQEAYRLTVKAERRAGFVPYLGD